MTLRSSCLHVLGAALAGALLALTPTPVLARKPERPATYEVEQALNIRYFPGRDRQVLDIFRPRGVGGAPVVLFVHGGTWMVGDKDFNGRYRRVGQYLAAHGLVAVLINYRLSPVVRHPEHIKDVARAFAWTARNVGRYGGDPRRIFLSGHSSGAHLVSLLATSERYLADSSLRLTAAERGSLRGVMAISGVYRIPGKEEFQAMFAASLDALIGSPEDLSPAQRTLRSSLLLAREWINPFRMVFGGSREVQLEASPITHVRRGLPPFLLLVAESEVAGLRTMAHDFAAALRKAEVPVELRQIEGSYHQTILYQIDEPAYPVGPLLLNFVTRHAGRRTS